MEDKKILNIAKECLQYIETNRVFVIDDIDLGEKFVALLNEKIETEAHHINYVDGKPGLMFTFYAKKEEIINALEEFIKEREK